MGRYYFSPNEFIATLASLFGWALGAFLDLLNSSSWLHVFLAIFAMTTALRYLLKPIFGEGNNSKVGDE